MFGDFFLISLSYGCESWTIKKAEHRRIDAFELRCWRRLLRVPWTSGRFNQSILKKISPEYSLEGLMLKLELQYFGHLLWRTDSFEKTLMLGKTEEWRRRGRQRMRCLNGITDSMDMSFVNSGSWWWTGRPGVLQRVTGLQRVRHDWATELNWTDGLFNYFWALSQIIIMSVFISVVFKHCFAKERIGKKIYEAEVLEFCNHSKLCRLWVGGKKGLLSDPISHTDIKCWNLPHPICERNINLFPKKIT